jgi:hypothetical protein
VLGTGRVHCVRKVVPLFEGGQVPERMARKGGQQVDLTWMQRDLHASEVGAGPWTMPDLEEFDIEMSRSDVELGLQTIHDGKGALVLVQGSHRVLVVVAVEPLEGHEMEGSEELELEEPPTYYWLVSGGSREVN